VNKVNFVLESMQFRSVHVTRSSVLFVMLCRSLFVVLFFFFWPLCCLPLFDW